MKGIKRYALFLVLTMVISFLTPGGKAVLNVDAKGDDADVSQVFVDNIEDVSNKLMEQYNKSSSTPDMNKLSADPSIGNGMEGEGTEESPYLVKTGDDLYSISLNKTAHYKLVNDIDFLDIPRTPIGDFSGVLDGDGHTIKNFKIVTNSAGGLFILANDSTIKNLTIQDSSISGTGLYNAAFFGLASKTTLENCNLIGVDISGKSAIGGFGGVAVDSTVTNCHYYSGSIKSIDNSAGSLIGAFFDQAGSSVISNCSASITIDTPNSSYVGGLIGSAERCTLSRCFSNSIIKGQNFVGGLVGVDYKQTNKNGKIYDCYSSGEIIVSNTSAVCSGLVGETQGGFDIKNSYSSNKLPNTTNKSGLASDTKNTFTSSYFDKGAAGITTPAGQARSKEQMYQQDTYKNWDFNTIWSIEQNKDYAKLKDVPDEKLPVQDIAITPDSSVIKTGETLQLRAIITPANAENRNVSWKSSNPAVLTVDDKGLVTAVSQGFAAVAAHTEDGCHIAFSNIMVEENIPVIPVESISVTPESLTMAIGEAQTLNAQVLPENATNPNVSWTSSNEGVAAVDAAGNVTAISAGTSIITATTEDGGHTSTCAVTVNEIPPQNIALQATATSNSESSSTNRASKANDGDPVTRWLARSNVQNVYLELDFGQPMSFSKIKLTEFADRIDSYALQIWNGSVWVDIHTGNRIGPELEVEFDTVTSDKVRLMVYTTLASYGPSIYEFEVY